MFWNGCSLHLLKRKALVTILLPLAPPTLNACRVSPGPNPVGLLRPRKVSTFVDLTPKTSSNDAVPKAKGLSTLLEFLVQNNASLPEQEKDQL